MHTRGLKCGHFISATLKLKRSPGGANNENDVTKVTRGNMDWTQLAQDWNQWRPFLKKATDFRVPLKSIFFF